MIRGTTPTHTFTLPDDFKAITFSVLYITYEQGHSIQLEKTLDDVHIVDGVIVVTLTQEETLAFNEKLPVRIQIRARTNKGQAIASQIMTVAALDVLKEGVI